MSPSVSSPVVRRFWDQIREGMSASDAGVAVGVSMRAGWRWFADAGGVRPTFPVEGPRRRPRLTLDERNEIQDGMARRESLREMARRLGRAPSTIMREIERNGLCRGRYRSRYRFGVKWHGGWECIGNQ